MKVSKNSATRVIIQTNLMQFQLENNVKPVNKNALHTFDQNPNLSTKTLEPTRVKMIQMQSLS